MVLYFQLSFTRHLQKRESLKNKESSNEIKSLPPATQTIVNSVLSSIESSGTSATTVQDLTKLASLLSNKNLSPTQLAQDLSSLLT